MAAENSDYSVEVSDGSITVSFRSAPLADLFMNVSFSSRLLHSFRPDSNGVWRPGKRMTYEISGWPKYLVWTRKSANSVSAPIPHVFDLDAYLAAFRPAFEGIKSRVVELNGGNYFHFKILNDSESYEYLFNERGRGVTALCVLFDLEAHPRDHLEVNIPSSFRAGLKWPIQAASSEIDRHFGDPSKTADVLRNEGWSRESETAQMVVFREKINGQQQQQYQLLTREQHLGQQVKRTAIKPAWRKALFESQEFTCRICMSDYSHDTAQLSPDHRVPVIFEADNLTDANFDQKLMTLCRFCNQQKREFTKRVGDQYDWEESPWAYPEKFRLGIAELNLREHAKVTGQSPARALDELKEKMGPE